MQQPLPTENEILYDGLTMITETDANGIITYVNSKFMQMTGYRENELLGRSHNILRHPDMPKVIYEELWSSLIQDEPWKGHIKNRRKDGSFYWAVVIITPKHDESGKVNGYIAIRETPAIQSLETIKECYRLLKDREMDQKHVASESNRNSCNPETARV